MLPRRIKAIGRTAWRWKFFMVEGVVWDRVVQRGSPPPDGVRHASERRGAEAALLAAFRLPCSMPKML
jgi:hypothetical protein